MQLALWQQDDPGSRGSRMEKHRRVSAAPGRRSAALVEPTLAEVREEVQRLSQHAYARNTRRAYQSDWDAFSRWCTTYGERSMPATVDTLRSYIAYLGMSGLRPSTIRRKRVAIGLAHAHAGLPRPDLDARVREIEHGLAKTGGPRPDAAAS